MTTPRTDRAATTIKDYAGYDEVVPADVCRDIERDLAELGFFAHELAQGDKFEHGATLRAAIDAAMEAEEEDWFERERHDKIMSGMDAEDKV